MLRSLATLAGLVLAALAIWLALGRGTRQEAVEPEPVHPRESSRAAPEAAPVRQTQRHDEAGVSLSPESRYVGFVGELRREEDGTLVDGASLSFGYRYVSKGPDSTVKTVLVEVDERGAFEQLFSEPVHIISVDIEPPDFELPELGLFSDRSFRASFLHSAMSLDLVVDAPGARLDLNVRSGLEVRGRVFDSNTNVAVANVLVHARADLTRTLSTLTDSTGTFRLRGFGPALAESGRDYVDRSVHYDTAAEVRELVVEASPRDHRPAKLVVPLPLSSSRPAWVEIGVAPGFRVAGRISDRAGQPVRGACLEVASVPNKTRPWDRQVLQRIPSRSDGRFEFSCVEALPNIELIVRFEAQGSPQIRTSLADLHEDRDGLEFTLPECQVYRIRGRLASGEFVDANTLSVLVRDTWGERQVSVAESLPAVRVSLAIGTRSEIEVVYDSGNPRFGSGRARTTLEPLVRREEPETVVLDLAP